jgi:hypothetical protein
MLGRGVVSVPEQAANLPGDISADVQLNVISQYFPGYPAQIRARLGGSDPGAAR